MKHLEIKQQILQKIIEYQTIIIVRHIKPDGDCIGSSLGLREILRLSFPGKKILSLGKMKSTYLEFVGLEDKEVDSVIYQESLVIVVDTANRERIDDDYYHKSKYLIKLDHHIPVEDYGNINYVREDLPATALIIADFYNSFKDILKINQMAAAALFVGTITDTGRFKYSGVNADVLNLSAMLLEQNINLSSIYTHLYTKDKNEFKLHGYVLNKFKTTKNGVAYFIITRRILKKFRVSIEAASALINVLDSIKGHLIWMFFIESKQRVFRIRLRSRFISINELASRYNGGGHAQASGATVYSNRQIKQIINEADLMVKEFKMQNPGVF
ncbi:MAG: bifunctional oligoribonuclease/PAP phosphatase NrnA [Bacilli bacterium]|nr:bifunctional oligoribonuclease/PAP phosphatase NrnA [Bacilli bacterium]